MTRTDHSANRTVKTLLRQPTDRVPIFEHAINGRFIRHAIGVEVDHSLHIMPKEHLQLARFVHMDLATLGYYFTCKGANTREALKTLRLPSHADFLARVDDYLRVLDGTEIDLNVYVSGPFCTTYLSMGYEQFFLAVQDDLPLVEELMDLFTEDAVLMVKELLQRNLASIQVADDIAFKSGLFVRPDLFRSLWFPRMKKIMAPIHAAKMPCFFHSDGDVEHFIRMIIDLGFMGINPLETQCNNIGEIKRKYGKEIVLMGNLDIGGVLAFGSAEDVRRDMKALLKLMMPGAGYVAMSSSSVADCVVPENYMAMVDTVLEHGRY